MGGGPGRTQSLLRPRGAGVDHAGAGRLVGPGWADRPVPIEYVAPVEPHQRCKGRVSPGPNQPARLPTLAPPPGASGSPAASGRQQGAAPSDLPYPGGCGSGGPHGRVWRPRGSGSRSSTQRRHLGGRAGGSWGVCGGMHLKIKWDTVRTGGLPSPGTPEHALYTFAVIIAEVRQRKSYNPMGGRGNLALTNQNDEREGLGR